MQPDLIARIEAAQPSEARELFLIAFHSAFPDIDDEASQQWFSLMDKLLKRMDAKAYLDAAAMFVPDGWAWSAFSEGVAIVSNFDIMTMHEIDATTPYYALLAAAMKARQTCERD